MEYLFHGSHTFRSTCLLSFLRCTHLRKALFVSALEVFTIAELGCGFAIKTPFIYNLRAATGASGDGVSNPASCYHVYNTRRIRFPDAKLLSWVRFNQANIYFVPLYAPNLRYYLWYYALLDRCFANYRIDADRSLDVQKWVIRSKIPV